MSVFALDFDGVLCDDRDLILDFLVRIKDSYTCGYEAAQSRTLINLRKYIGGIRDQLCMFPCADNVVSSLSQRGDVVGVISSNLGSTIEAFLRNHGILDLSFVYSDIDFYSKGDCIKMLSEQYNDYIYYVGDEVRDVLAAKWAGVFSVAVASGMGNINDLVHAKPDYLLRDISSVPTIG